ncbi:MAG: hypothetical protein V1681_04015 [Candidatus Neomarinimicrobiota bacterium]
MSFLLVGLAGCESDNSENTSNDIVIEDGEVIDITEAFRIALFLDTDQNLLPDESAVQYHYQHLEYLCLIWGDSLAFVATSQLSLPWMPGEVGIQFDTATADSIQSGKIALERTQILRGERYNLSRR